VSGCVICGRNSWLYVFIGFIFYGFSGIVAFTGARICASIVTSAVNCLIGSVECTASSLRATVARDYVLISDRHLVTVVTRPSCLDNHLRTVASRQSIGTAVSRPEIRLVRHLRTAEVKPGRRRGTGQWYRAASRRIKSGRASAPTTCARGRASRLQ